MKDYMLTNVIKIKGHIKKNEQILCKAQLTITDTMEQKN